MVSRFAIPLAIFTLVGIALAVGLKLDPRHVPSPFIGKPAPEFTLPVLDQPDKTFSSSELNGKVWLLNVWGSWCPACYDEHPVLNDMAERDGVTIVGLNWKDETEKAKGWLTKLGNPYLVVAVDKAGDVAIDYGVYGAPETFVIDKKGMIRYKHVGPVTEKFNRETLYPLLEQLQKEPV